MRGARRVPPHPCSLGRTARIFDPPRAPKGAVLVIPFSRNCEQKHNYDGNIPVILLIG